jgi:hypothetical protein
VADIHQGRGEQLVSGAAMQRLGASDRLLDDAVLLGRLQQTNVQQTTSNV